MPTETHEHPSSGGVRIPQWVFILLGGGGIAIGGGGLTVSSINGNGASSSPEALELRLVALEEEHHEMDEEMDQISKRVGAIRDNQLLICVALDVECAR